MAIGKPIGTLYAELDLDSTRFTRAQKTILREAGVVTMGVEKNYKTLGIKSAAIFDAMRDQVENAYQGILHSSRSTADDIVRAEQAKNAKIKKLNDEQFGEQEKWYKKMSVGWSDLGKIVAGAFSINALKNFSMELFDAGKQMSAIEMAFTTVTGSAAGTNAEFDYLRTLSKEAGQNFYDLTQVYKGFLAASKGTNIEGEKTRHIFEAVTKASASLGLSADETKGSLYAIQQMMSKGTVSSEELRQQLGERLPGAYNLMAEALGVSTKEMSKMLEQGEILSDDALPKLADLLEKRYPGGAAESVAATNRLAEAWMDLKVTLAKGGVEQMFAETMTFWAEHLGKLTNVMKPEWVDNTKKQLAQINFEISVLQSGLEDIDEAGNDVSGAINAQSAIEQISLLEKQAKILTTTLEKEMNPALKQGAIEAEKEYKDLWVSFADESDAAYDRSLKDLEKWEKANEKAIVKEKKAAEKAAKEKERSAEKALKADEKLAEQEAKVYQNQFDNEVDAYTEKLKEEARLQKIWNDYNKKQDEQLAKDRLIIAENNAKKRAEAEETFVTGVTKAYNDLIENQKTAADYGAQAMIDAYDLIQETSENVIYDALTGDLEDFGDYADDIFNGVVRSFSEMLSEMIADWAMSGIKDLLTGTGDGSIVGGIADAIGGIWDAITIATSSESGGGSSSGGGALGTVGSIASAIKTAYSAITGTAATTATTTAATTTGMVGGADIAGLAAAEAAQAAGTTAATTGAATAGTSASSGAATATAGAGALAVPAAMVAWWALSLTDSLGAVSEALGLHSGGTPWQLQALASGNLSTEEGIAYEYDYLLNNLANPFTPYGLSNYEQIWNIRGDQLYLVYKDHIAWAQGMLDEIDSYTELTETGLEAYKMGHPNYGSEYGGERAMGGSVYTGNDYLVGEKGPEIFSPNTNGTIIPNNKISSGAQIPDSMNFYFVLDGKEVQKITINGLRENPELANEVRIVARS